MYPQRLFTFSRQGIVGDRLAIQEVFRDLQVAYIFELTKIRTKIPIRFPGELFES